MQQIERPVIDLGVFSIFGESAGQVFGIFLTENEESYDSLRLAIGINDLAGVKRFSHKMAGSAKVVRAEKLAMVAAKLETAAEEGNQFVQSLFEELTAAYGEVRSLIVDLRQDGAA